MTSYMPELLWTLHQIAANTVTGDETRADIAKQSLGEWQNVPVPGTVAQVVVEAYCLQHDIDDFDWCYLAEFSCENKSKISNLKLEGLATLAEVWLDDKKLLLSENMFVSHYLDIEPSIRGSNTLKLIFRSLNQSLALRRPRPRWKTNLVNHQQLRWIRTSLLGRIPGWTSPLKAIGPWKGCTLLASASPQIASLVLKPQLKNNLAELNIQVQLLGEPELLNTGQLSLQFNGVKHVFDVVKFEDKHLHATLKLSLKNPKLWWPHTHGEPALYDYAIQFSAPGNEILLKSGRVGFREISLNRENGKVELCVNGKPIFMRGACWTSADPLAIIGEFDQYEKLLKLAQSKGANMLRVGGTMCYEADEFYALCDEYGILLWQDFMFANMDYPFDDDNFKKQVSLEVQQQLIRLASFASVCVYCGGSEVQQQSAMFGMPSEVWESQLFDRFLPDMIDAHHPQTVYFSSAPCEGALPFHTDVGVAHYFGVGAYKRSYQDLWQADVKFASECLAFANFPHAESRKQMFASPIPATHSPQWKNGVCRDNAAGWDFSDITDFYLRELFAINPEELRYSNLEKYHQLSEIVPAEIMATCYQFWRSSLSACSGALIWFFNDLKAGAGWGLVDSLACAKPVLSAVAASWQSTQVVLVDRGLNGHYLEIINEANQGFVGHVEISIVDNHGNAKLLASQQCQLGANDRWSADVDALAGTFLDSTYAYRFGKQNIAGIAAVLFDEQGRNVSQTLLKVGSHTFTSSVNPEVSIELIHQADTEEVKLEISATGLLYFAAIEVKGFEPEKNYFHLIPGQKYFVSLKPQQEIKKIRVSISAVNTEEVYSASWSS